MFSSQPGRRRRRIGPLRSFLVALWQFVPAGWSILNYYARQFDQISLIASTNNYRQYARFQFTSRRGGPTIIQPDHSYQACPHLVPR